MCTIADVLAMGIRVRWCSPQDYCRFFCEIYFHKERYEILLFKKSLHSNSLGMCLIELIIYRLWRYYHQTEMPHGVDVCCYIEEALSILYI
jgi:hypothetical protein